MSIEILVPKPTVVIDPFIIDATKFTAGTACAQRQQYAFERDLVSKDGRSPAVEMGIIVHKILEVYYRARMNGTSHDLAVVEGFKAGNAIMLVGEEEPPPGRKVGVVRNLSEADDQDIARTMMEYFQHYRDDSWTPIGVECVKQGLIYEDRDIRIIWKAIFDLLCDTNQGVYPVDHKTMRQRRDTVTLNHQLMGQSVLARSRGVIINKVGFQKTLKAAEKFTRPLICYTAEQLHEWATVLVPYWAKQMVGWQKSGYYPRNYASCETKYGYCPFKPVCECPSNMREEMIANLFVKGEKWDVPVE